MHTSLISDGIENAVIHPGDGDNCFTV